MGPNKRIKSDAGAFTRRLYQKETPHLTHRAFAGDRGEGHVAMNSICARVQVKRDAYRFPMNEPIQMRPEPFLPAQSALPRRNCLPFKPN